MPVKKRVFNEAKAIKQLEAKGFDKVGQEYEGEYLGTKETQITDSEGTRDATIILLKPDEGDRFGVWANAILTDMVAAVQPGTYIKIRHTKVSPPKGENRSGTKLFTIIPAE